MTRIPPGVAFAYLPSISSCLTKVFANETRSSSQLFSNNSRAIVNSANAVCISIDVHKSLALKVKKRANTTKSTKDDSEKLKSTIEMIKPIGYYLLNHLGSGPKLFTWNLIFFRFTVRKLYDDKIYYKFMY